LKESHAFARLLLGKADMRSMNALAKPMAILEDGVLHGGAAAEFGR
jgi:hypothetical protein